MATKQDIQTAINIVLSIALIGLILFHIYN